MTEQQLVTFKRLVDDFTFFAPNALRIKDKQSGLSTPFTMNEAQLMFHRRLEAQRAKSGMVRAVAVKGRQQGVSTYTAGRYFHKGYFTPDTDIFVMAHRSDSAEHLFGFAREYYRNLPDELKSKLQRDNAQDLTFSNGTAYSVGTAGAGEVGRGRTIRLLHASEVAYWMNSEKIAMGLLQAVPEAPGTEIIFESTAKCPGDYFHAQAMRAAANTNKDGTLKDWKDFQLVFVEWFLQTEYTRELPPDFVLTEEERDLQYLYKISTPHLIWRRKKILDFTSGGDRDSALLRFNREYPNTLEEAFRASDLGFFNPLVTAECVRRWKDHEAAQLPPPLGAKVIGVDPARNRDKTVITIRQGKKILRTIKYGSMNEMQLAGIIARLIETEDPDAVFRDVGYGYGTIDRLVELGFGKVVKGVNFGESAMNKAVYRNKRIEMHADFREWMADGGMVPDDATLLSDINNLPMEKESSSGGKYLCSKDEIRDLIGRSPDDLDSVVLTFAFPVRSRTERAEVTARRERVSRKQTKHDPFESIVNRRRG